MTERDKAVSASKPVLKWEDITSYSQNDELRTPKSFEAAVGAFALIVTRHRDYSPETWLMHLSHAGPRKTVIGGSALAAKLVAEKWAGFVLSGALQALGKWP